MKLIQTINELRAELDVLRKAGKTIGLVPTMGALHAGHASLVKRAVAENDVVVVSDFVNPTQFNDKNDLLKYPRTLEADCKLLEACGASFVFAPSVEEIYPEPDTRQFSYAPLDTVMVPSASIPTFPVTVILSPMAGARSAVYPAAEDVRSRYAYPILPSDPLTVR